MGNGYRRRLEYYMEKLEKHVHEEDKYRRSEERTWEYMTEPKPPSIAQCLRVILAYIFLVSLLLGAIMISLIP